MPMQTQSQTTYDDDWDEPVDDFGTEMSDYQDIIDSVGGGRPGIRIAEAKDYLLEDQAAEQGWYDADADLTAAQTRRFKRIDEDFETLLEKLG